MERVRYGMVGKDIRGETLDVIAPVSLFTPASAFFFASFLFPYGSRDDLGFQVTVSSLTVSS